MCAASLHSSCPSVATAKTPLISRPAPSTAMFSPYTWGSKGGGRPSREPPSPDAPDITVGPADALGQPQTLSSAASNTGGNTASANVPSNHSTSAAAFDLAAVITACLAYITSLINVLISAGGPHGQLHVFQFVKHLLPGAAGSGHYKPHPRHPHPSPPIPSDPQRSPAIPSHPQPSPAPALPPKPLGPGYRPPSTSEKHHIAPVMTKPPTVPYPGCKK